MAILNLLLAPVAAAVSPCSQHSATMAMTRTTTDHQSSPGSGAGHMVHGMTNQQTVDTGDGQPCDCCDEGPCLCQASCHFATTAILYFDSPGLFSPPAAQTPAIHNHGQLPRQPLLPPFRPPIA